MLQAATRAVYTSNRNWAHRTVISRPQTVSKKRDNVMSTQYRTIAVENRKEFRATVEKLQLLTSTKDPRALDEQHHH